MDTILSVTLIERIICDAWPSKISTTRLLGRIIQLDPLRTFLPLGYQELTVYLDNGRTQPAAYTHEKIVFLDYHEGSGVHMVNLG